MTPRLFQIQGWGRISKAWKIMVKGTYHPHLPTHLWNHTTQTFGMLGLNSWVMASPMLGPMNFTARIFNVLTIYWENWNVHSWNEEHVEFNLAST
jgi:hypothetical protein